MTETQTSIQDFIDSVCRARNALQIDVPGWTVRQPPISEVEKEIVFVIAESREGEHLPFILPATTSCLCVTKGDALLTDATGGNIPLIAPRFHVLAGGADHRQMVALVHPTTVICLFFRTEGMSGGFTVDSR